MKEGKEKKKSNNNSKAIMHGEEPTSVCSRRQLWMEWFGSNWSLLSFNKIEKDSLYIYFLYLYVNSRFINIELGNI